MNMPELYLYFNPPITNRNYLKNVLEVIELRYPEVLWSGTHQKPTDFNPLDYYDDEDTYADQIVELVIGFFKKDPNGLTFGQYGDNERNPNKQADDYDTTDGREWYEANKPNYDQIYDTLTDLNEGIYKPKLHLKFDPPIDNPKDMDLILQTFNKLYPKLRWRSGVFVDEYRPFGDSDEYIAEIEYLTIGYFQDNPDRLTFTETIDHLDEDDIYQKYAKDGWMWLEDNKTDYGGIYDMLNSLD